MIRFGDSWVCATCKPKDWQLVAVPAIFPLWWTLWALASILSWASFAWMRADQPAQLMVAKVLALLSIAVDIPLTVVAIWLVSRDLGGAGAAIRGALCDGGRRRRLSVVAAGRQSTPVTRPEVRHSAPYKLSDFEY